MENNEKKDKIREIIVYLIVGVLTTVFCWVLMWILVNLIFGADRIAESEVLNVFVQSVDWLAGVLFAYPLNRKWVFKSTNPHVMKELLGFGGSRVSTWILDVVIMLIFVNVWPLYGAVKWLISLLGSTAAEDGSVIIDFWFIHGFETTVVDLNFWIAKIFISSVLVMIVNYIFSKLLIFKKKKN